MSPANAKEVAASATNLGVGFSVDQAANILVSGAASSGNTTLTTSAAAKITSPGVLSGVTYDGSNRATSWTIDGVTYTATYSTNQILVTGSDITTTRITLDGTGRISALALQ
jgi:hypothetical protein